MEEKQEKEFEAQFKKYNGKLVMFQIADGDFSDSELVKEIKLFIDKIK